MSDGKKWRAYNWAGEEMFAETKRDMLEQLCMKYDRATLRARRQMAGNYEVNCGRVTYFLYNNAADAKIDGFPYDKRNDQ